MEKKYNTAMLSMLGQAGSVFGIALNDIITKRDDLLVLSADMSTPAGLDKFKSAYPEHFYNLGIAEQNMIGVAAGLTHNGYKVICQAQACFLTMRDFEQIRQYSGYMGIPIIYVGIGAGFSLSLMGNTHYALEDISLMRNIPGMTVTAPCDALEAVKVFEAAMDCDGPVYIRLNSGNNSPVVYQEDFPLTLGKAIKLTEGKDVRLVACGAMVKIALEAAEILKGKGLGCEVIDMHTVKPLDTEVFGIESTLTVTIEEHRSVGGLGDAVASYLAQEDKNVNLLCLHAGDEFPAPGSHQYLLEKNGLIPNQIVERIITKLESI